METEMPGVEPVRNEMFQNLEGAIPLATNYMNSLPSMPPCDLGYDKVANGKTKIFSCQKDRRKLKRESDPEYRERERLKNLERTRKLRSNPKFRDRERLRNMLCKRKARLDPNYREAEKMRNRLQKRKARENPTYREAERNRNMWQKRKAREDPTYRIKGKISGLGRKCKTQWDLSSEEWFQLGPVQIDAEAEVALEHGLYKLIPEDKHYPPEEEFSGWTEMEKDLFTKLYFNSRNPDLSKLSESPPADYLNQIDHNNFVKTDFISTNLSKDSKHIGINNNNFDSTMETNLIYDSYNLFNFSQHRHSLDKNNCDDAERVHMKNNRNINIRKIKNIYDAHIHFENIDSKTILSATNDSSLTNYSLDNQMDHSSIPNPRTNCNIANFENTSIIVKENLGISPELNSSDSPVDYENNNSEHSDKNNLPSSVHNLSGEEKNLLSQIYIDK